MGCDPLLVPRGSKLTTAGLYSRDRGEIGWDSVGGKRLHIHFDQTNERTAEIRCLAAAAIHNDSDADDDASLLSHDIDRLLDAAAARYHVLRDDEALVRRILKPRRRTRPPASFSAKICRLPNERPTSCPTMIPPRAGEMTASHSRSRNFCASWPHTFAAISVCCSRSVH
jgi:hypothetical protein